jgi:S-adenosylmethionine synthetase
VAAETMCATGLVVSGPITTSAAVNYSELARNVIKGIGYDDSAGGFDYRSCAVLTASTASPQTSPGRISARGLISTGAPETRA